MYYFLLFIFQLIILIQKSSTFEYIPENDLAKICRPVNRPIDLLFLLDGSGSVGGNTFQTQMEILDKLIDILEIGPGQNQSQLAVMQYATYSFVEFPFSAHRNKSQLRQALQRIRHKSGTTKTGKALEKAIQLYKDKSSGARFGNVAKVVVVVSDGRSLDDPVPTAIRLRQTGVFLISLGIGTHVNLAELLQMSGDSEMVFDEQTENKSVERFTDLFKRLSTAEACEFVRGGNGADIRCGSSVIEVLTTTKTKFRGIFYVQGHWLEPECIGMIDENGGNGTELVLRIPLGKCGLEKQFSTNPKGYFFRGTAILQFHPNFRTGTDKIWKILCFYRDHSSNEPVRSEDSEIEWQLIRDHTQRKDRRPTQMPCSYRLLAAEHMEQMSRPPWGNNAATGAAECLTRTIPLILGQNVIHSWECNSDHFDVYQSFLINSCFLEPSKNNEISTQMLIDKNGCSTEPTLIETPQYVNQLKAFARGVAIRGIGNETTLRLRCSLKFCDRLMGECEEILPPKCGKEDFEVTTTTQINSTKEEGEENKNNNENNNTVINKRRRRKQSGFPVLIRPLNGDGPAPPLVMFTKSSSKRRRPTQIDKRNFIVKDELIKNEKEKIVKSFETTVKTTLLENKKRNSLETTIETTTTTVTKPLTTSLSTSFNELIKDSKSNIQELTTTFPPPPQLIEEDSIITRQTKNENKKFNYKRNEIISTEEVTGKADPFQEENDIVQNEGNLIKEEINLDPELLTGLNENEIIVISQQVEIGETEEQEGGTNNSQCSRKKRTTTTTNILNGEGKFY